MATDNKRKRGKHKVATPTSLPPTGFLRLPSVLFFIPVSRGTWHQGVRDGLYPSPVKISKNLNAWRAEDIRALIAKFGACETSSASGL